MNPEPPGPWVFSLDIRSARVPSKNRLPANVMRNARDTYPGLWLEDYHLACRTGGAQNDDFIIRNLPLYLADSAHTWLEHLPANQIHDWADLREIFVGNFEGTYERPGNLWDLKNCQQKPRESLQEYIWRFSKECNAVPNVEDADVIGAFLSGTTCESLVHKLGHKVPQTTKELLDIATNHASIKEAMGATCDRARDSKADRPGKKGGGQFMWLRPTARPARPLRAKSSFSRRCSRNLAPTMATMSSTPSRIAA